MSILIVDDSVVICKALTILLRKAGYEELVSLSSAAEARSYLEAQKEGEVELVLLDFQMPDETGLELLTQLKRDTRFRDIPFIMITAEKEETILEQAFSAGATDYISKPLRPIELAARVRSAPNSRKGAGRDHHAAQGRQPEAGSDLSARWADGCRQPPHV